MAEKLPPFVLAQLFSGSFIITEDASAKPVETPVNNRFERTEVEMTEPEEPATKWYLGDNKKHITIVVSDENNSFISDEHLQFLISILSACKLNLADIALVNIASNKQFFSDIKNQLEPRQVILFGIPQSFTALPFTIPEYQLQSHNNCAYLFAPQLDDLNGNSPQAKEKKGKLWLALKKMFNV